MMAVAARGICFFFFVAFGQVIIVFDQAYLKTPGGVKHTAR